MPSLTQPALVIVGDPSRTRIEQVLGADERLVLGIRAVRAVKVPTADAAKDPLLAPSDRDGPRVVVLGLDGRVVSVVPVDRVTAGAVYAAMKTAVQQAYGSDLDVLVTRERDVRRELDRLDVERRALVVSPLSDIEWKSRSAQLDDRRRDLEAKEREIWALKARAA